MHWRISADGQLAHATQIRFKNPELQDVWSVIDLCDFIFVFLRLSLDWWKEKGYFGDGLIFADIGTDNLPVSQIRQGAFGRGLNPGDWSRDWDTSPQMPSALHNAYDLAPAPAND